MKGKIMVLWFSDLGDDMPKILGKNKISDSNASACIKLKYTVH